MNIVEAKKIVKNINYKNARIMINDFEEPGHHSFHLVIHRNLPCVFTGKDSLFVIREQFSNQIFESLSESDLVRWTYELCLKMEAHETGEWFKYKNIQVFDPHKA